MRKRVFIRAADDPESLTTMLVGRLSETTESVGQMLEAGSIYVDGERATVERRVSIGAKVIAFLEGALVEPNPLSIVHQDEWIIVVDKPAGMPSQAERSQRARALDAQVQRTVCASARLIHRLDKEASGLVLFATHRRACAPLQTALTEGRIDRRYVAIVDGELQGEGTIGLRIGRHATDSRLRAALPEHAPAGQSARSHWRALERAMLDGRPITALALTLDSGRTHQLRVHLSGIGHPIVGDAAYGGRPFERLCLQAHALELPHPHDGRPVRFAIPQHEAFARLVPGLTSPSP
jgi:23S rRNA pseudouridine1911/1915/1917 synthase